MWFVSTLVETGFKKITSTENGVENENEIHEAKVKRSFLRANKIWLLPNQHVFKKGAHTHNITRPISYLEEIKKCKQQNWLKVSFFVVHSLFSSCKHMSPKTRRIVSLKLQIFNIYPSGNKFKFKKYKHNKKGVGERYTVELSFRQIILFLRTHPKKSLSD